MITAVDSCVLIDILIQDPKFHAPSIEALSEANREGRIIISTAAIAEIFPCLQNRTQEFLDKFSIHHIAMNTAAALEAGRIYASYRKKGGDRNRVVADFLIGAHSQHHADRLLTRDKGFKRTHFSDLKIWYP